MTECPLHANKECILKRINELNLKKAFSVESKTDQGLPNCSNLPERPTDI